MESALKLIDIIGLHPLKSDKYSTMRKTISFLSLVVILISAQLEFLSHLSVFEVYNSGPHSTIPPLQSLLKMATLHFYKNELIDLMEKSKSFWKLDKFGDLYKQELSKLHRLVTIIVYIYIALLTATCVQLAVLTLIFRRGKPIFLCYGGLYGLESPHYEIYSILDAIGIGVISIAVSGYDAMFFFFALDIYTEFKMIKSAFKRHSDQTVSSYNKQFIEAVKHHDFLLQYINQVNDIFSPMFLFQFFSGLLGICFSLFMISRSGLQDINTLSIYSAGLLGFTAQSYTFCLVGEVISELSEDISNEIFYTDWLDDEVYRNKTAILIVMNRAQESPKLTIGKFADMNLRTFIMIVRNAYSFLAFINNALD
nr:PREDICTED: odorant receptor 85a-like [Tribolium castaneum]|eukprot:XP_015838473.1 PREDICTED: odorant receptor 85a-like [Tribolium castaneum]